MKALAINSSPRTDKGNTDLILKPFLEGLGEARAEVELFCTKKLTINPCTGCFHCWLKKPGECWQDDDMKMLLPKIMESEDTTIIHTTIRGATWAKRIGNGTSRGRRAH